MKVCVITRNPGESDEAFDKENKRALGRFFEIFDNLPRLSDRPVVERRNLYGELALGDHGEDVYLSEQNLQDPANKRSINADAKPLSQP